MLFFHSYALVSAWPVPTYLAWSDSSCWSVRSLSAMMGWNWEFQGLRASWKWWRTGGCCWDAKPWRKPSDVKLIVKVGESVWLDQKSAAWCVDHVPNSLPPFHRETGPISQLYDFEKTESKTVSTCLSETLQLTRAVDSEVSPVTACQALLRLIKGLLFCSPKVLHTLTYMLGVPAQRSACPHLYILSRKRSAPSAAQTAQ